jgi:type III restriction enzyme
VPGINRLGTYGRWAFAELTEIWQMQDDFANKVEADFERMLGSVPP